MRHVPFLLPALLALACGPPGSRGAATGFATGAGTSTGDPGTSGTDATGEHTGDTGGSAGGNDPAFDVGVMPDVLGPGHGPGESCTKVDLLFAIDNSGSMATKQTVLAANFPAFVQGIETKLGGGGSYHVGVVTSDDYFHNEAGCNDLGHLVTQTGGNGSSKAVCGPYSSGQRYMDETEPDLGATFACAAQVGADGSSHESPAEAAYRAVSPEYAATPCNEGFLRDDALLVVVIISDEDDRMATDDCPWCGSVGTPAERYQAIVDSKGGVEENVVMLSIINQSCNAYPPVNLIEMTEMFTHGSLGDVCSQSYAGFFDDALSVIDTACDGFQPPG